MLKDKNIINDEISISLHPVTLSFYKDQKELEKKFRKYYYFSSIKVIRISCWFGLFIYSAFGILDYFCVPAYTHFFWILRYAVVAPLTVIFFIITFLPFFKKAIQPFLSIWILSGGFCILIMILAAPPPTNYYYYAGLILIFMMSYTVVKMRFIWATVTGLLLVLLYEIFAIFFFNAPKYILISNNFFFIGANIIGMFACYLLEYYSRKDFVLKHLLNEKTHELIIANQNLEELSLTDPLTGLPNRRCAISYLSHSWEKSIRENSPLSCIMIDADHFKNVNDTQGHDAGDIVLAELAKTIKYSLRNDDFVCRLGGDEFFIICPYTDLKGGLKVAENIHNAVSNLSVKTGDSFWRGSISVGVAERTVEMKYSNELIKTADKGVYQAKQNGKNRVETILFSQNEPPAIYQE